MNVLQLSDQILAQKSAGKETFEMPMDEALKYAQLLLLLIQENNFYKYRSTDED